MLSLPSAANHILPALVTPLTPAGQLDVASLERLIGHLYQQGVGGLYVTGSTGEGIYLDFQVRKQIVEIAVALSKGRGLVVVHVGAIQAVMVRDLAEHAASAGADGVSSIPPFAGGYSWGEVHDFYAGLASASQLPVIAYHIPSLTGQRWSLEQLTSLISIPNVAGYKFTDTNLYIMQRLLARFRHDQIMYNGHDEMLALGLQFGAHGGIGTTYNFMPELILQVARHCREGRFSEAVGVQGKANEIIEAILASHGLAATKQILYWQGLIDHPHCVPPRALLTGEQRAALRRLLKASAIAKTLVRD
jgi:N-acetylneuraminate lyase